MKETYIYNGPEAQQKNSHTEILKWKGISLKIVHTKEIQKRAKITGCILG